ncbi:MAG: hypothetical protein HKM93_16110 [Desulfobacteraceae bacterium]|nr:hypothetical protein [Desulfobacteraceae bacterium]
MNTTVHDNCIKTIAATRFLSFMLIPGLIMILCAITAPMALADEDEGRGDIPFSEAGLYFELNNTDGDLGIHALIDGDPWQWLSIEDTRERKMLNIRVSGRLRRQGLTEIFFESAEPTFDELAPERFFRRFPEGRYEIEGITLEGSELESTVVLTHLMPAPPENILVNGQAVVADCEVEEPPVAVSGDVTISWDFVTHSHPDLGRINEPITVVKYQVVVEREEPTLLIYSVDLPPTITSAVIPAGFIEQGDEFKFEILVRESSGNQTAMESCFNVAAE